MKLITEITGNYFEMVVLEAGQPVVVEFFLPGCSYHQQMRSDFKRLAKRFDGRAKFMRVDVEEEPTLSAIYI